MGAKPYLTYDTQCFQTRNDIKKICVVESSQVFKLHTLAICEPLSLEVQQLIQLIQRNMIIEEL